METGTTQGGKVGMTEPGHEISTPGREVRQYVSLPPVTQHTKHPTDEASGYAQNVHPAIVQKYI